MKQKTITLIRHAECKKNIQDVNGGEGTALTCRGRNQARRLHSSHKVNFSKAIIYASPVMQAVQTAKIFARCKQIVHSSIEPLSIGQLAGISRKEALLHYPDEELKMKKWRNGNLEISELDIPGMENCFDFYLRGLNFMKEMLSSPHKDILIVSSRSVCILLHHICHHITPRAGDGYVNIEFNNCKPTQIQQTRSDLRWVSTQIKECGKLNNLRTTKSLKF